MQQKNVNVVNEKRVVIPEVRNRGSSTHSPLPNETTNDMRGRFPSPSRTGELGNDADFITTIHCGFTLIELLVVVLIIGILAAVAVPQYQVAVGKARFATYRALADTIANAARAYNMASGEWPSSFDELSVDLPSGWTITSQEGYGSCGSTDKIYCCLLMPRKEFSGGIASCAAKDYSIAYISLFASDNGEPAIRRECQALPNQDKICKSLGGTLYGSNTGFWVSPSNAIMGYNLYLLP